MNILLAVDIGNTTINSGIFKNGRLTWQRRIPTGKPSLLKAPLRHKSVSAVIISSVVPRATVIVKRILYKGTGIKPLVLGENIKVPIKNLYKNPAQVGQDRLVNAYAGYKKFGGGLIIVDFGTAVTFDVVSRKGEYLGGIIVPGIETSLKTLSDKAALLPQIRIRKTNVLIGKDTKTSMLSGVLHGYGAVCDGLISRIEKETGQRYKVILTGGHAGLISRYCRFHSVQSNLTMEGLNKIFLEILRRPAMRDSSGSSKLR